MSEQELRFADMMARLEGESTVVVGLSSHAIGSWATWCIWNCRRWAGVSQGQAFGVVESSRRPRISMRGKRKGDGRQRCGSGRRMCSRNARAGWLAKIEVAGLDEYEILMDADAYKKFVETQEE